MDPENIPFNALIVDPTNSGKTQFLVNQLHGPFNGKFDYIVLICPTFAYNRTLYRFGERDPRLYVIICEDAAFVTPVCPRLVFGNAVPAHLVKYCIQPLRDRTF